MSARVFHPLGFSFKPTIVYTSKLGVVAPAMSARIDVAVKPHRGTEATIGTLHATSDGHRVNIEGDRTWQESLDFVPGNSAEILLSGGVEHRQAGKDTIRCRIAATHYATDSPATGPMTRDVITVIN